MTVSLDLLTFLWLYVLMILSDKKNYQKHSFQQGMVTCIA